MTVTGPIADLATAVAVWLPRGGAVTVVAVPISGTPSPIGSPPLAVWAVSVAAGPVGLGAGSTCGGGAVPDPPGPEEAAVARSMPGRQLEFAAGRHAARLALGAAGRHAAVALPVGPDRAPIWPAGWTGSITHTRLDPVGQLFAAAVVVPSPPSAVTLGLDAEPAAALPPGLLDLVLCPNEVRALRQVAGAASIGGWLGRLAFSAKEAAYKWYAPRGGRVLEFSEVTFALGPHDAAGIPGDLDANPVAGDPITADPVYADGLTSFGNPVPSGDPVTSVCLSSGNPVTAGGLTSGSFTASFQPSVPVFSGHTVAGRWIRCGRLGVMVTLVPPPDVVCRPAFALARSPASAVGEQPAHVLVGQTLDFGEQVGE